MELRGLHRLCIRDRRGNYILDVKRISLMAGKRVDLLFDWLRDWCFSIGVSSNGDTEDFSGMHDGIAFRGSATRFRDELSVLLHLEGESHRRYRILGLWNDYSWSVRYREPWLGTWRTYPGGEKDFLRLHLDDTHEEEARERFEWICRRPDIKEARLMREERTICEYHKRKR